MSWELKPIYDMAYDKKNGLMDTCSFCVESYDGVTYSDLKIGWDIQPRNLNCY